MRKHLGLFILNVERHKLHFSIKRVGGARTARNLFGIPKGEEKPGKFGWSFIDRREARRNPVPLRGLQSVPLEHVLDKNHSYKKQNVPALAGRFAF
jgi:hypothetical protein